MARLGWLSGPRYARTPHGQGPQGASDWLDNGKIPRDFALKIRKIYLGWNAKWMWVRRQTGAACRRKGRGHGAAYALLLR